MLANAFTIEIAFIQKIPASIRFPLTGLMPYNGGVVELTAAMLAVKGDDFVKRFITVVSDFSSLLVVPQFSTALGMIGPVANGVEELVGTTDGTFHLGLHLGLTGKDGIGDNKLRAGYVAIICSPQNNIKAEQPHLVCDTFHDPPHCCPALYKENCTS
jgi:hypothetical protein